MLGTIGQTHQFDAFITYRRSDGSKAASWLRNKLLHTQLPKQLLADRNRKLAIYLDTSYERATQDFYTANIRPNLERSRFLLVVCTPDALKSRADGMPNWVEQEVSDFLQLPHGKNVVAILAKGDFDGPLPAKLRERYPNIQIVDLRTLSFFRFFWWPWLFKLRDENLKVVAALFDISTQEMPLLRQEERRRTWGQIRFAMFLVCLVAGLAILTFVQHTMQRAQLVERLIQEGAISFIQHPAQARFLFVQATEVATPSHLSDLGISLNDKAARAWLGQEFS